MTPPISETRSKDINKQNILKDKHGPVGSANS
jgi:hypothetical protein